MTTLQIEAEIEAVLGEVPFEGVSVAYCEAVRDALRRQLPGFELDVMHRYTELVVEARRGAEFCRSKFPLV